MKKISSTSFLLCMCVVLQCSAGESARIWRSVTGNALEASLVVDRGTSVVLKKASGETVTVKRNYLSSADHKYLAAVEAGGVPAEEAGKPTVEDEDPSLAFKGLKLGMTRADIEQIERETSWEFQQSIRPTGTKAVLKRGFGAEAGFHVVGGPVDTPCTWIEAVALLRQDRVYNIAVSGPSVSIESVNSDIKNWLAGGLMALTEKHGKPTSLHRDSGKPRHSASMTSSLRRLASYEEARWEIGEHQIIKLRVGGDKMSGEYFGQIVYTDLSLKKPTSRRR